MPSLFSNDTSKGPLYQYWRERSLTEEKSLRDQRIEEAKLRSKGFTPLDAAYGPSSQTSYDSRKGRGPPGYASENVDAISPTPTTGAGGAAVEGDALPAYIDTSSSTSPTTNSSVPNDQGLLSASEEKARLNSLEAQHQQTQSDAAIAQTLSNDVNPPQSQHHAQAQAADIEGEGEGTGKQPERRKSTAGKVGRWFADAASGYTKKQERW